MLLGWSAKSTPIQGTQVVMEEGDERQDTVTGSTKNYRQAVPDSFVFLLCLSRNPYPGRERLMFINQKHM